MLQNKSGTDTAAWWQKLAADFPSFDELSVPKIYFMSMDNSADKFVRLFCTDTAHSGKELSPTFETDLKI
jgi:hypothetical protein